MHSEEELARTAATGLAHDQLQAMSERLVAVERRASTFAELTRLMAQGEDPNALAQRAVDLVRRATGATGTYVYLWDVATERLIMRVATSGQAAQYLDQIRLRLGEGINGWCALMRQPVVIEDNFTSDARFVGFADIEEDHYRSMVAVPIVAPGGDLLGVFSLYSEQPAAFDTNSVTLAIETGSLLANGLVHAQTVEDLRRNSEAARFLVALPAAATASLDQCVDVIAERVLKQVDADLCTIEVSQRTASDVGVRPGIAVGKRADRAVVAASKMVRQRSDLARLAEPFRPEAARITSTFGGAFPLGAITCYRTRPFSRTDEAILEALGVQAAALVASIRTPATSVPLAGRLLAAPTRTAAHTIVRELGWAGGPTHPVLVRLQPSAYGSPTIVDRMIDALNEVARIVEGALVVPAAAVVTLLVPHQRQAWPEFLDALRATLRRFGADSGDLAAGVGRLVSDVRELPAGLEQAQIALTWAEAIGGAGTLVSYEDIEELTLLPQVALDWRVELSKALADFRALARFDAEQGADLFDTLQAYLSRFGSATETSRALFIHRNTLRHRLRRIEQVIGHQLDDTNEPAVAALAARLARQPLGSSPKAH